MNFKCTKIKQKITNGNHDVLLFVMYSNTTIEITKMLKVMMIHPDGMDHSLHETKDTSFNNEFVTFNGPKQLRWVAMVVVCTTPPQQASMSCEH